MPRRFDSRARRIAVRLGVVILVGTAAGAGLVATEYRATYSAQSVAADDVRSPVAVRDLPPECRSVARRLAAGRTVFEEAYELRTGGRSRLVRRNVSGWRLGDPVCGEHVVTGGALRVDGRHYRIWGTERRGKFWYRHKLHLSLGAVSGATLILGGLGLGRDPAGED